MPDTELSDESLSRLIAERIEPLGPLRKLRPRPSFGALSRSNCWIGTSEHEWKELDMVNDPAMTVMLLKLPGFVSLTLLDEDNVYDVTFCGEKVHSVDCGVKMMTAQDVNLGRAVAEGYAKAEGLIK